MITKFAKQFLAACAAVAVSASVAWAGGDLAAAKKEGKVVWYSSISLPIAQEMCNTFNSKKMGFECVLHRSGSGKLFKRWLQEAKSNIYEADVLHTSNSGHFVSLRDSQIPAQGCGQVPDGVQG